MTVSCCGCRCALALLSLWGCDSGKQITIMHNQPTFPARNIPTASMISPTNATGKRFTSFPTLQHSDPFSRTPHQLETSTESFPKALASQSMINTATSGTRKQATLGKLDSMARKVTTNFKEETPNPQEHKQIPDSPFTADNSVAQSMIGPHGGGFGGSRFRFSRNQPNGRIATEPTEPQTKKRRESIDLGFNARRDSGKEFPFLRKSHNGQQETSEATVSSNNNSPAQPSSNNWAGKLENMKQKQFDFMHKMKETHQNQPKAATQASNIGQVQSMKNLHTFPANNTSPLFKKPQQMPVSNGKMNSTPEIKCPQDSNTPVDSPQKPNGLRFPGFEFKKKKASQTMDTLSTPKPVLGLNRPRSMQQREMSLDDFELLEKLGKGAFGEVFMAQQKHTGFMCVIKKMSKKRIKEKKVEEHILREIKIQFYLNHPLLTALFGCFHDQQYIYLILQALPDGSLQQVKRKRKLPEKEAAGILGQVSEGLKYMHEECIIHRDLKPQNLFVNEMVIKLGDFGCSIYNVDARLRTTVVGCLEYSSPEQLSQNAYSDKIDSWSLGILAYELMFGKSPFESQIRNLTKQQDKKAELSQINFPQSIPISDEAKDFIFCLLDLDPEKRMDMDETLSHPFLRDERSRKIMKFDI